MERKSGFKECPKCGLRNKPDATQCDFCGQNLGASDDWQHHVKDLESLNKMELRRPLDDRTSKRIESTIIRKDAPASRNMGIKEAGNIGKALKELDEQPAKQRPQDHRDERPRHAPAQDKLRIKEASSVPLVEKDFEWTPPMKEGTTIADILRERPKEAEAAAPSAEPQVNEEVPAPVTLPKEAEATEPAAEPLTAIEISAPATSPNDEIDEPSKEVVEPPMSATEPVKTEEPQPPMAEPQSIERPAEKVEPDAVPETPQEVVPANEVTIEVVQQLEEEVPSTEVPSVEEQQITVSSNDPHETIKLKLVEVERPKERLSPMVMAHHASWNLPAVAVLALGSVAYLIVLALTAAGVLGTTAGLGGGAVSSFMMIYGAAVVFPSLRRKNEAEVYICPKCHEKVGESSDNCPACGIEFESED